jgi:HSP20 family protein
MALLRWSRNNLQDPFAEFDRLQEEMGRLFGLVNRSEYSGLFDRNSSPAVDVLDEGEKVSVYCNLPGIDLKDIDVNIANNVLSIKGERKPSGEKRMVFKDETWTGSFQRTISLPPTIDPDKVKAELSDGVLRIKLDKKPESKPRQITVALK